MEYETLKIRSNGIEMHVTAAGEGPPVLLLHGFPDTHRVWKAQIGPLAAAGYRVYAPDLRGYGQTEAPGEEQAYAMEQLEADVIGLLDALDIEQVKLVGHDWGAMLGWYVAMHAPERVERLVALSVGHPGAYASAGVSQWLRAWYIAVFQLRGVAESLILAGGMHALRSQAANEEQFADWKRELMRPGRLTAGLNYYRANAKLFADRSFPRVKVPVLGVWSEKDVALVEEQMTGSEAYVDAGFTYKRIDGAGHWLQLEMAQTVNKLLLEFFAKEPIASRGTSEAV